MPSFHNSFAASAEIAERGVVIGAAWHVVLAMALAALLAGWRPSQRLAAVLLCVPLASVSASAWWFGDLFNALLFAGTTTGLGVIGLRLPARATPVGSHGIAFWGLGLIVLGWLYPHFFNSSSPWTALFGSPLGVLPSATLAAVLGLAILGRGLESRAWSSLLAGLGLFYGVTGTHLLHAFLDTSLTIGGLILLGIVWSRWSPRHVPKPVEP